MKNIVSLITPIFFFLTLLEAQTQVVVVDSVSNEPIPFVQAYVVPSQKGFVADSNGVFQFTGLEKEAQVTFRALGYRQKEMLASQVATLTTIALAPSVFQLEAVNVNPKTARDFVQTAVEMAPYYFVRNAVNSTLNIHERITFNGNLYEANKSIVTGYFIPLVDSFPDTSRIVLKAYKGAVGDTSMKNKQFKKSVANELHEGMMDLLDVLQEQGSPYKAWDSGFVRMFINQPDYIDDYKYKFESFDTSGADDQVTIRAYESLFPNRSPGSALIRMNYKTMQINHATFTYKLRGAKATAIKSALFLLGFKLKDLSMNTMVNIKEVSGGYVPAYIETELNLHIENIHLFRKNDVYNIVSKQHYDVTEIVSPATDQCKKGVPYPKNVHISKFMNSDYHPELINF